jgi:probable phosphoglycerate mutase
LFSILNSQFSVLSSQFSVLGSRFFIYGVIVTTFYLIRHGETDWNVTGRWQGHVDVPLNAIGEEQARRLAHRLRADGVRFDALYSSDLKRAWATAQTISAAIGLEPRPLAPLREINLGWWGGLTRADIAERDPDILARIDAGEDLPRGGAERWHDVYERVSTAVEQLAETHPGRTIAIATHGGPVRMLLRHAVQNGAPPPENREHIGNTSITILERTPSGWAIKAVNDMAHLSANNEGRDLATAPPDDIQQA